MKNLGKISQSDYDDGIQTVIIEFEDGTQVEQKREWPEVTFRGEKSSISLHESLTNNELYDEAVMHAPELMYGMLAQ